jgi:hypothetical protein
MKKDWDISYCGLNCAMCSLYLIPDDKIAAERTLNWFKQEGWRPNEMTVEQFMRTNGRECEGCRGPIDKCWSKDDACHFRSCAQKKQIDYCFDCLEFPCNKIETFKNDDASHHDQAVKNLETMKEIGLEEFIKQKKKPSYV